MVNIYWMSDGICLLSGLLDDMSPSNNPLNTYRVFPVN